MTCFDCKFMVIDMDSCNAKCNCLESLKYGICVKSFESCEKLEREEN